MKIKSNLYFKSFFLSFIVFALLAGIILTSLYMDKNAISPLTKETNVLMGISHNDEIVSLTVLNFDPESETISFVPVPDNTLLNDNKVLQSLYSTNDVGPMISSIEGLIGAKIDRYIIFSPDAVEYLTNEIGKFEYVIPYEFIYNEFPRKGTCIMNGELAKAMFTYSEYDMTKVSFADMADSFLQSFLSKHANVSNTNKLINTLISHKVIAELNTNLSEDEIIDYCKFLAKYSSLTHRSLKIEGKTHATSSRIYFTPDTLNSEKNIFK